jgi:nucleolar protein 56
MYLYSNILGTFVFSQNLQIREKILFSDKKAFENHALLKEGSLLDSEKKFLERFKNIVNLRENPDEKILERVFEVLDEYESEFYKKNIFITRAQISESVSEDLLIIQSSNSIEEINKTINLLVKRLREWYSYILPEVEEKIEDHAHFAELILSKSRAQLVKDFSVENSMGKELGQKDMQAVMALARTITGLFAEKSGKENYLEELMKRNCPNITEVAGYHIGARLISIAGSLRNIIMMPSSTVQLLGAEKALFRHMVNKNSKPPKHGIIHEHPLLQKAKKQDRGKVARTLADKILLAAKVDFFKGEFIGTKIKKEMEEKFR